MRLFLAIDLPKEIKEYLWEIEKKIKEAKISWVAKKNLHLTLKFLGEVQEKELPNIKEKIRINAPSVKVSLSHLGFFPNQKQPKVIWVSLSPESEIIAFQQKLDAQLLNIFPNDQKFQAHITLGRVKSIRRKEDFQNSIKGIHIEPKAFVISSYQLMKSELKKTGPVYETLANSPLSEL